MKEEFPNDRVSLHTSTIAGTKPLSKGNAGVSQPISTVVASKPLIIKDNDGFSKPTSTIAAGENLF